MLDEKRLKFIDMLIEGRTSKTDMATILGVHRTTIYNYLEEESVQSEISRRLQLIKNQGEKRIASQLEPVIDELFKLALTSSDKRVKANCCQYLINRIMGTPTSNVSVGGEVDIPENTSNALNDFKAFMMGIDKSKDENEDKTDE